MIYKNERDIWPLWTNALIELYNHDYKKTMTKSVLYRKLKTTIRHTFDLIKWLEYKKLVYINRKGKLTLVKLTEEGVEMAKLLIELKNKINTVKL